MTIEVVMPQKGIGHRGQALEHWGRIGVIGALVEHWGQVAGGGALGSSRWLTEVP